MPYHNMNASMEFAFDDNNTPVMAGKFIELANDKMIDGKAFFHLSYPLVSL